MAGTETVAERADLAVDPDPGVDLGVDLMGDLEVDIAIIGAGINGMVAAAELGQQGWSVALIDRNDRIGGFVAGGELTLPGYQHDTYSSWHPLFVSGAAWTALGPALMERGLAYCNTDGAVSGSVSHDGRSAVVAYRDPARTVAGFADPEDRAAYLAMLDAVTAGGAALGPLLAGDVDDATLAAVAGLGESGQGWLHALAASARSWSVGTFVGREPDQLLIPWMLHQGLGPDIASGAFFAPLFAATLHGVGLPVVQGGATRFVSAFERLLADLGVAVLTGETATRIEVSDGRAVGVRTDRRFVRAGRAVIASVTPTALYGGLLADTPVPDPVRRAARSFRFGRGAMQVHVALSRPLRWRDERLAGIPMVHISDGSGSTGVACAEALAGLLPKRPTIVVGQQYLLDPSRVPEGAGALWLQLQEVPFAPVGDAAGELDTGSGWTDALVDGYVERILGFIDAVAPGLRESVLAVRAIPPTALAAANPNAVRGDPYGGATALDQSFPSRPLPGIGRTGVVERVWQIGASTHPGPGLGGWSGHIVANALGSPA